MDNRSAGAMAVSPAPKSPTHKLQSPTRSVWFVPLFSTRLGTEVHEHPSFLAVLFTYDHEGTSSVLLLPAGYFVSRPLLLLPTIIKSAQLLVHAYFPY